MVLPLYNGSLDSIFPLSDKFRDKTERQSAIGELYSNFLMNECDLS